MKEEINFEDNINRGLVSIIAPVYNTSELLIQKSCNEYFKSDYPKL